MRPPIRPLTDSRSDRVWVELGSMAYSAVTQPRPLSLRHRGTPVEALAAHSTRVLPNSTSTDPAAWSSQFRVIVIGRSSSAARPSGRVMPRPYPAVAAAPQSARSTVIVTLEQPEAREASADFSALSMLNRQRILTATQSPR